MNERTTHRVAILGFGIMGSAFARRALSAGLAVTGWDRTPERVAALEANGVKAARTPAEAATGADVVVTMVADAPAVMNVMRDQQAFAAMPASSTWAQMATIGLAGIQQAADLATTRPEVTLLDAPVSGSKTAALAGQVVVLASGNRELANPGAIRFFSSLAQQTHWLGPVGAGTRMKLMLNAWIAVLNEGVAEIMGLADVLGVEAKAFTGVVSGGPIFPPWALGKVEKIAQRRTDETEFPLKWADKDVRLALDAAGEAGRARLPILNDIANVWASALDEFGTHDLSAVYEALARRVTSADASHVRK